MRLGTLPRYLLGSREAILEIAADRRSLWIGFLFVLSAGLAREYDGEDLLRFPQVLLQPLGASLVSSFILFSFVEWVVRLRQADRLPFLRSYLSFLGLFWMTAPLAWLYAIPYERFLDSLQALQANLWSLALVAAWRVLLIARVISVLVGCRAITAFCLTMCFADTVTIAVLGLQGYMAYQRTLMDRMAGIRPWIPAEEQLLASVRGAILSLGCWTYLLWPIASIVCLRLNKPPWNIPELVVPVGSRTRRSLDYFAWASVLVWAFILPYTQPEQRLRRHVEIAFRGDNVRDAMALMSERTLNDFPPYWQPPPQAISYLQVGSLLKALDVLVEQPPAPWVRETYLQKLDGYLTYMADRAVWAHSQPEDLDHLSSVLQTLPEGRSLAQAHHRDLQAVLDYTKDGTWDYHKPLQKIVTLGADKMDEQEK